MTMLLKHSVNAQNCNGVRVRVSKGNRIQIVKVVDGVKTDLPDTPHKKEMHGRLTQQREWRWEPVNCTLEIYCDDDVDVHAIHVLQPHDPRTDPRPRRKGKRAPRPEVTT